MDELRHTLQDALAKCRNELQQLAATNAPGDQIAVVRDRLRELKLQYLRHVCAYLPQSELEELIRAKTMQPVDGRDVAYDWQ